MSYLENILTNVVALSGKRKVVYKNELALSARLFGYSNGEEIPRRDLERFAQLAMVYHTELRAVPELERVVKRDSVTLRFTKDYDPGDKASIYEVILGNSLGFLVYHPDEKGIQTKYGVLYFDGHEDKTADNENWQEFHKSVKKLLINLNDNFYDSQVTLFDRE